MDINERYRPKHFDEIVGHKAILRSLRGYLADTTMLPHSFLFSGPSGVGKTTIARILASELGCKPYNIMEQDGISQATVEPMRDLFINLRRPAIGESPQRAVILNEAHKITSTTWKSILQDIEEPPAHLFIILCTTEPEKIPEDVLTRVLSFKLKPLSDDAVLQHLIKICSTENINYAPENLDDIVARSKGSLRVALNLASLLKVVKKDDFEELTIEEDLEELSQLYDAVIGFQSKDSIMKILDGLNGVNPEAARKTLISALNVDWKNQAKNKTRCLALYAVLETPIDPLHGIIGLANRIFQLSWLKQSL